MKNTIKINRMNKGGYNAGWMIPVNAGGFSVLLIVALRYGISMLVVAGILYLSFLYMVGRKIEAMQPRSTKQAKVKRQKATKPRFVLSFARV